MQYDHIIQRQIVEIGFSNRAGIQELYREVSNLCNLRLSGISNRVFDQLVPAEDFIRIESLEIDLGTLSYPINETVFAERYEAALIKTLSDQLKKTNDAGREDRIQKPHTTFRLSYADLFQQFLMKGIFARWSAGETLSDPASLFFKLLEENKHSLTDVLVKTGPYAHVRKRLVNQFTEAVLIETISLVEPTQATFITNYHKDLVQLQQKESFIKTETGSFSQSLWYFILTYVFAHSGSYFQRKMLVKSTFMQMAANFNISYEQLLFIFSETANTYPDLARLNKELPFILSELQEEHVSVVSDDKTFNQEEVSEQEETYTDFEVLSYYFFYGSLPFRYRHFLPAQIETMLQAVVKQQPARFKQVLEKEGSSELFRKRLTHVLSEPILVELITLIEPAQAAFIINYQATTLNLQKKKNMVKAEESEFRKSLWEFIFAFLLNDRGTLFNEQVFVESNIRQLARHYNMSFKDLLLFLTQGIGEEFAAISKQSSLFYIFTQILRSYQAAEGDKKSLIPSAHIPQELSMDVNTSDAYTHDLLLFWLTEGYLPWWANSIPLSEPLFLLSQFIRSTPKQAWLLLQLALQKGLAESILVGSLFTEFTQLLQQEIPDGHEAFLLIQELAGLRFPEQQYRTPQAFKEALLLSALETYYKKQFLHFDPALYFSILLKRLHKISGLKPTILAEGFIQALQKTKSTFIKNNPHVFVQLLVNEKETFSDTNIAQSFLTSLHEGSLLLEESLNFIHLSSEELLAVAVQLLTHFLTYRSFPEHIAAKTEAQQHFLLRRLSFLIYQQDQAKLKNIFDSNLFSVHARMQLHTAFAEQNNQENRNIAAMLQAYVEKDTLQYLQETWSQIQQATGIEEVFAWIKKNTPTGLQKKIHRTLFRIPAIAHLAASSYTGEVFKEWLLQLTNNKHVSLITNYTYLLGLAISDSFERENLVQHFREFCLSWFSAPASPMFSFSEFLHFITYRKNWNMRQLHQQLAKLPGKLSLLKKESLQKLVITMQTESAPFAHADDFEKKLAQIQRQSEKELIRTLNTEETYQPEKIKEPRMKEPIVDEGEPIYLHNAGLALLHPFIPTFFVRTGLVGPEKKFINEESHLRAPLLLQYLVSSSSQEPEHNLVLNKILCGLNPADPIPLSIELTDTEKKIAEELLQAVILNWEKLKITSVQGLQSSFLQRTGVLNETAETWTLQVEPRAYDILLQTLPWGLSMLKSPWMNKPLLVTWI